eukprot:CAMPEP_0205907470 /NCGR_PEP_ID=MMETSP1325-20131115/2574_1 /ASSEMBLY_ACC=CAM_ASM_000708 /TAXON_ID=236786 /ORGANISM="Florenciella sp., Strain RCC1007" /LENGTH=115 /DNA_ID=CAMNT_0053273565 /DNA_START=27 /DNA_END=374 /DNA_ORIENTATION=+
MFRGIVALPALGSAAAFMPANRAMPARAVQVGASGSITQIENRDTQHPPLSSLEGMEEPWQPDAVATVFMDPAKAEAVTVAPPPPPPKAEKKAKKEGGDAKAAKKAKKAKKAAKE